MTKENPGLERLESAFQRYLDAEDQYEANLFFYYNVRCYQVVDGFDPFVSEQEALTALADLRAVFNSYLNNRLRK